MTGTAADKTHTKVEEPSSQVWQKNWLVFLAQLQMQTVVRNS